MNQPKIDPRFVNSPSKFVVIEVEFEDTDLVREFKTLDEAQALEEQHDDVTVSVDYFYEGPLHLCQAFCRGIATLSGIDATYIIVELDTHEVVATYYNLGLGASYEDAEPTNFFYQVFYTVTDESLTSGNRLKFEDDFAQLVTQANASDASLAQKDTHNFVVFSFETREEVDAFVKGLFAYSSDDKVAVLRSVEVL